MRTLPAFIFMLMIGFYGVYGQTISDFNKAFGKPVGAYQLFTASENISLKPVFDKNGQVCRLWLSTQQLPKAMPFENFKSVIDKVIPVDKRGAKHDPFGGWTTGGGAIWSIFTYEEVSLVYSGSFDRSSLKLSSEGSIEGFSIPSKSESVKTSQAVDPKDDFNNYKSWLIQQVHITWKKRMCE